MWSEYFPTTLATYFTPAGIDIRRDFPWIDFPRYGPQASGDAVFDLLDWTSSLPATAPALTLASLGSLAWTVTAGRRRQLGGELAPLWLGALGSGVIVLGYPAVANRYLVDLFALVLVGGMVGFHALAGAHLPTWARRATTTLVALLVVSGALVNLALGLMYQRERGPAIPESWRAEWVAWRVAMPGAPEPRRRGLDDELPRIADGALVVVGDCAGLYLGMEDRWFPVERGPKAGVHDLRVDLDTLPAGVRVPLVTFGEGFGTTVVGVVRYEDHVRFDMLLPGPGADWVLGPQVELAGEVTVRVDNDPRSLAPGLSVDGMAVHHMGILANTDDVSPGWAPPQREGVALTSPVPVRPVPDDMSLCREALDTH